MVAKEKTSVTILLSLNLVKIDHAYADEARPACCWQKTKTTCSQILTRQLRLACWWLAGTFCLWVLPSRTQTTSRTEKNEVFFKRFTTHPFIRPRTHYWLYNIHTYTPADLLIRLIIWLDFALSNWSDPSDYKTVIIFFRCFHKHPSKVYFFPLNKTM